MIDSNLDLGAAERAKKSRDYANVTIPRSGLHQSLSRRRTSTLHISKNIASPEKLFSFLSLSLSSSSDAASKENHASGQRGDFYSNVTVTPISKREKRVRGRKGVTLRGKVPRKSSGECNYRLP
jgi:hypothetical protein